MSLLRQQVYGVIETCQTVLTKAKGSALPPVDPTTIDIATAILQEAKQQLPNDKVLAAVKLVPPYEWTGILSAMQIVERSIPLQAARRISPYMR